MKKKLAFTLAETLIVIAIIGIIASIVTPMLFGTTNNAENIAKWKKTYSEISQAWMLITQEAGGSASKLFATSGEALADDYGNAFLEKLNYIKKCTAVETGSSDNPCWHEADNWYFLNKVARSDNRSAAFSAILNNGSFFYIGSDRTICSDTLSCFYLGVDINGEKPPNTYGKDIFIGYGYANGKFLPAGANRDVSDTNLGDNCVDTSVAGDCGMGCSKLALYCNKIDYANGTCLEE
ncbi:MAG: prepilin-type N-terminal cleavage/methylation domain-containing protein [Candidatus Gastranaerophilales bacterium]|nr:prepilin-type N-terminal cleavage/methylation domain-containing protein [Candidatus Gastranaerophilales bacterium]